MSSLESTALGSFLGFGGALSAYFVKRWFDTRSKKSHIKNSLRNELQTNLNGLDDFHVQNLDEDKKIKWDETKKIFLGDFGLAEIPSFDSSVNSGDFLLLDTETQSKISKTYHNLKLYNDFMNQIIYFSVAGFTDKDASTQANKLIKYVLSRKDELRKDIPKVISSLEPKNISSSQEKTSQDSKNS